MVVSAAFIEERALLLLGVERDVGVAAEGDTVVERLMTFDADVGTLCLPPPDAAATLRFCALRALLLWSCSDRDSFSLLSAVALLALLDFLTDLLLLSSSSSS